MEDKECPAFFAFNISISDDWLIHIGAPRAIVVSACIRVGKIKISTIATITTAPQAFVFIGRPSSKEISDTKHHDHGCDKA